MKRKRFSVEQITVILKQAELGTPVKELCRIHGVSEQSLYCWKKIYGGMEPSGARELKQLVSEVREEPRGVHERRDRRSGSRIRLRDRFYRVGRSWRLGDQRRPQQRLHRQVRPE